MMVFAHTHTGPVDGGPSSSRFEARVVQLITTPHTKWTERRGPDTGIAKAGAGGGGGLPELYIPNVLKQIQLLRVSGVNPPF
jgi:hypothetical protein